MARPAATAPDSAVRDIARRFARLAPDWSDPRRYYQRRDDLVDELEQLADLLAQSSRGGRR